MTAEGTRAAVIGEIALADYFGEDALREKAPGIGVRWADRVQQTFGRAAARYDEEARIQLEIARELSLRILSEPADVLLRILDVGTGTGNLALHLACLLPGSRIAACDFSPEMVQRARRKAGGDSLENVEFRLACAERLPYPRKSFTVVVSSLALHWADRPGAWLKEMARVLLPGGKVFFATAGPHTLPELRTSLKAALVGAGGPDPSHANHGFLAEEELAALMGDSGFSDISLERMTFVETHPCARSFLRSLGARGTRTSPRGRNPLPVRRGLLPPAVVRELLRYYDLRFADEKGNVPASYEVIFGKGVIDG